MMKLIRLERKKNNILKSIRNAAITTAVLLVFMLMTARELETQETVEKYYRYQNTLQFTKGIMMESLYTMVCPPVFTSGTVKLEAVRYYYEYLQTLQKEYLELVEFCFDESFHPDLLGERCPAERFHLYRPLRGLPISFERKESL